MTDGQWLFTLFLLLYLVESLRLQPGSAWLMTADQKVRRPFLPLDFAGRHLMVLPSLPPFQAFANLRCWELVPCASGLEFLSAHNTSPSRLIPWDALSPGVDGSRLILNSEHQLHCANSVAASLWHERLLCWKALPEAAREEDFLKLAAKGLDSAALSSAMAEVSRKTQVLRWLGTLIFMTCFGVITLVYRRYGDSQEVLIAVASLIVLQWLQAFTFWRACGQLAQPIKHRFWKTLACAFLPQNAMRAADHLCEALSPEAHPLASISVLADSAQLKRLRPFWKRLQHTDMHSADLQKRALNAFLKAQSISEDQLQEIPEQQPGSVAYCPQCLAQFRDPLARCKDCGDLNLQVFADKSSKPGDVA